MEREANVELEVYCDHDAMIEAIEADIAASKAMLASLSNDEDQDIF